MLNIGHICYSYRILGYVNKHILMLYNVCCRGLNNWASPMEIILCSGGFGYVWLYQEIGEVKTCIQTIKLILTDIYLQEWLIIYNYRIFHSDVTQ